MNNQASQFSHRLNDVWGSSLFESKDWKKKEGGGGAALPRDLLLERKERGDGAGETLRST